MNNYLRYILFFHLFIFAISFSYSQDIGFKKNLEKKNDKKLSAYIEHPVFFQHWGKIINANVEVLYYKKGRSFNPAISLGFGLELSEYGIETYAIPIEFKLVMSDTKLQFEMGMGLTIVDPDVMINSRFGFRTYLFEHLLVRVAYTPYFFVPYGDREYNEPHIEIKSDLSIGIGYRF